MPLNEFELRKMFREELEEIKAKLEELEKRIEELEKNK